MVSELLVVHDVDEPQVDVLPGHTLVLPATSMTLNVPQHAARLRVDRLELLNIASVQLRVDILPGLATLPAAGPVVLGLVLRPVRGQNHVDMAV